MISHVLKTRLPSGMNTRFLRNVFTVVTPTPDTQGMSGGHELQHVSSSQFGEMYLVPQKTVIQTILTVLQLLDRSNAWMCEMVPTCCLHQ